MSAVSASCQVLAPLDEIAEGADGGSGGSTATGGRRSGVGSGSGGTERITGGMASGDGGIQVAGGGIQVVSGGIQVASGGRAGVPGGAGTVCVSDGCDCQCPAGTACDPDTHTCEDATCNGDGQGVRAPCPAVLDAMNNGINLGSHLYEAVINDDAVCDTGYAVHLHCDLCEPLATPTCSTLPLCWARCVCDEELYELTVDPPQPTHCSL